MQFQFVFTYFVVTVICSLIAAMIVTQLTDDMGSVQELRAFRRFILCYLVFCLSNALWVWCNFGYLSFPTLPLSMINLSALCVGAYYWFQYVEIKINPRRFASPRLNILTMIPLAVALVFILSSYFTGLVFTYTESGRYEHGEMYPFMFFFALLYLGIASYHILSVLPKTRSAAQRREYYILMTFLLFPLAGGLIDIFVPDIPIMELTTLFGVILIYTGIQHLKISDDSLTGLSNRRSLQEHVERILPTTSELDPFYLFFAQVENRDRIIKENGPLEGDRMLKLVSRALRESSSELQYQAFRWEDDIFALVVPEGAAASPEIVVSLIESRLVKTAKENRLLYPLQLRFHHLRCATPAADPAALFQEGLEGLLRETSLS